METRTEIPTKPKITTQLLARLLQTEAITGHFSSESISKVTTETITKPEQLRLGDRIIIVGGNGRSQFVAITGVEKTKRNAAEILRARQQKTHGRVSNTFPLHTSSNGEKCQSPDGMEQYIIEYCIRFGTGSSDKIKTSAGEFFARGKILKIISG